MLPAGAPAGPPIDALGAALAKLVDREGDAELDSVERELASALEATPLDDAARAELVAVLVPLAVKAARRREHRHARRLLFHVLALTVGDPHDWLFEPRGPAAYRAPGDRITAFAALEAAVPTLEPLANAPDAVLPEVAEGSACSADRTVASLASTARLLCSFAQREELAEESAWRRACILVWGDEPVDAAATEAMARDPAEVPLVRAAAILRSGADVIAREVTPRAEVLALLAEVVTPMRRGWTECWAPTGLFAELGDRLQIALLSPAARVRFGASRPERVLHLTSALVAALDVIPDQWRARAALAGNLLGFALAARCAPWPQEQAQDLVVPTLEEVSALEREILEAVARKVSSLEWNYDVHHVLFELGLPASYGGLRRWLGIDPPGLMSTPVEVPIDGEVRVLPFDLAAQRMLLGRIGAAELARALARALSPSEVVTLTCEAFDGFDARLHCTGAVTDAAEREAIFDALRFAALAERGSANIVPVLLERLNEAERAPAIDRLLRLFRALVRVLEPGAGGSISAAARRRISAWCEGARSSATCR